ncbi:MAG: TlpA family protein disulfide reductase [Bacteroidetes bacterium]|nr:TlpA family protein disulfide reductase [Bacteroidota bacterium]
MKIKNIALAITFIVIIIGSFTTLTAKNSINVKPGGVYEIVEVLDKVPNQMTDFIFLDEDGNKCSLSEYTKGQYVFQNFWGTWCPPCRREIPDIIKLQNELNGKVIMVGIALERDANPKQTVMNYAKNNGINYINFVGPGELVRKLTSTYGGITSVPTTHIINKDGKVVETLVGALTKDGFQTVLDKVMQ